MTKRLLTVQELADLCDVKPETVYHWNHRGTGPKITRIGKGRAVRYREEDVEAWLNKGADTDDDEEDLLVAAACA